MLPPPLHRLGCVCLLRAVEEGAAVGWGGCCNSCERFQSDAQPGLGSALTSLDLQCSVCGPKRMVSVLKLFRKYCREEGWENDLY